MRGLASQLRQALDENDVGHLHLLPRNKRLRKARAKGGKTAEPAGAGRTQGYRSTVRMKTVGGGY